MVPRSQFGRRSTRRTTNGLSSPPTARLVRFSHDFLCLRAQPNRDTPPCSRHSLRPNDTPDRPDNYLCAIHNNLFFLWRTTVTLGVSNYAANALGDVVFVELPVEDTEFAAHDAIGAVESVKSASDILTPLAGKVIEVNRALEEKPATINKSPEGDGWIAKLELAEGADPNEDLMSTEEYKKFTEE